jgi:hypothetical protein
MTTPHPDDAAIRFTDPVKTRSYAQPTEGPDWSGWEAWMQGHKDLVFESVGEALGQTAAGLENRIKALELQLAEMRGAVDVLRGKGAPGCFRAKGTYDSKAAYNYLDVVVKDSSSFVALRDSPGTCPGDGWQMIACGGRRGPAGERGLQGPPGPTPTFAGARFSHRGMEIETSSGPIPLFKSVSVDAENFALKFIASDDSTLTISLLKLFEAYHSQTRSV